MKANELNKAAEEYARDETMSGLAERAFKAGAEWQQEQYECIPAEEAYMDGFTKGADEERELILANITKMRDTAEKRGLNFGAICGFQIALDELEQMLTGRH